MDSPRLLNLKEVSKILNINTEVLRRWLRNKKLPGVKVGSDWRVNEKDLEAFLEPGLALASNKEKKELKMCFRFPKWLEYSGLPMYLNKKFGPEAWPIFKKIIELDFEQGKPKNRKLKVELQDLAERVGYTETVTKNILDALVEHEFIKITSKNARNFNVMVVAPIKTPKLVLDISYENGGIKGAPPQALTNACLRRFLEIDETEI
ncbi:MAG: hypothetical protein Kow0029_31860 [Candidatus Rifleibacteriota bacterium]